MNSDATRRAYGERLLSSRWSRSFATLPSHCTRSTTLPSRLGGLLQRTPSLSHESSLATLYFDGTDSYMLVVAIKYRPFIDVMTVNKKLYLEFERELSGVSS